MSNLGFQTIYHLLENKAFIRVERFFTPSHGEDFSRGGFPPSPSFQSLVAFSVSFEPDYLNLLYALKRMGIPLRKDKRREGHPLVIVGGIAPTANPRPLSPIVDIFLLGEGDDIIGEFIESFIQNARLNQEERIIALSSIPGVYHPSLTPQREPWREIRVYSPIAHPAHSVVLSPQAEFKDTLLIEISRGCRYSCSFCLVRAVYKPYRFVQPEVLLGVVKRGLKYTRRVGLIGANLTDYPDLIGLCRELNRMGVILSFSSLRADCLNQELIGVLSRNGVRTLTLAPETSSAHLKRLIEKPIKDEDLMWVIGEAYKNGIYRFKLYYLIGLPGEGDEDVEAIVDSVRGMRDFLLGKARDSGRAFHLTLSVNPLIPKAGTSLSWASFEDPGKLKGKIERLKKGLLPLGNITIHAESIRISQIQAILSVGDESVGEHLISTVEEGKGWNNFLRRVEMGS